MNIINIIFWMTHYFTWTFVLSVIPFKFLIEKFIRPTKSAVVFTAMMNFVIWVIFMNYLNQIHTVIDFGIGIFSALTGSLSIGVIYVYIKLDPDRLLTTNNEGNKNV